MRHWLSRREFLRVGATGAAVASAAGALAVLAPPHGHAEDAHAHHPSAAATTADAHLGAHGLSMTVGEVDTAAMGYDPSTFISAFDYGVASTLPDGRTLRR